MSQTKTQKQDVVGALATKLQGAATLYVTDFTGLNVAQITMLRRKLRAAGVEYVVVKNTLARRALTETQRAGLDAHLAGPTALVLGGADPVAPAKVLTDFAKEHEKPKVRIGLVEGRTITPEQVKQLAALPSKPQLLAQLGGALQAPMAGFVGVMNGLLYMMVGALEALQTKRSAGAAS
jgi:large subunit ribosomal protein L10